MLEIALCSQIGYYIATCQTLPCRVASASLIRVWHTPPRNPFLSDYFLDKDEPKIVSTETKKDC